MPSEITMLKLIKIYDFNALYISFEEKENNSANCINVNTLKRADKNSTQNTLYLGDLTLEICLFPIFD